MIISLNILRIKPKHTKKIEILRTWKFCLDLRVNRCMHKISGHIVPHGSTWKWIEIETFLILKMVILHCKKSILYTCIHWIYQLNETCGDGVMNMKKKTAFVVATVQTWSNIVLFHCISGLTTENSKRPSQWPWNHGEDMKIEYVFR